MGLWIEVRPDDWVNLACVVRARFYRERGSDGRPGKVLAQLTLASGVVQTVAGALAQTVEAAINKLELPLRTSERPLYRPPASDPSAQAPPWVCEGEPTDGPDYAWDGA